MLLASGYALDVFEAAALGRLPELRRPLRAQHELVDGWSSDGFTPLMLASCFGRLEVVRFLVEQGAEVNAASRNAMRVMPLHSAAAGRHVAVAEALLIHGAQVNARQEGGFTPLHAARNTASWT